MPKGQWDRTKTKEQREAEKAALKGGKPAAKKAPVAKAAKPVTKAAAPAKKVAVVAPTKKVLVKAAQVGKSEVRSALSVTERRDIVVDNLDVLVTLRTSLGLQDGSPDLIQAEILENLKLFASIREEIFGTETQVETVTAEEASTADEEANGTTDAPPAFAAAPAWQPPPPAAG